MTNCSKDCTWYTPDCERFDCCECDCNPERELEKEYNQVCAFVVDDLDTLEYFTKLKQIEILEKIKEEIKELKGDSDYYEWYGIRRTINLINKRISELKGEQE